MRLMKCVDIVWVPVRISSLGNKLLGEKKMIRKFEYWPILRKEGGGREGLRILPQAYSSAKRGFIKQISSNYWRQSLKTLRDLWEGCGWVGLKNSRICLKHTGSCLPQHASNPDGMIHPSAKPYPMYLSPKSFPQGSQRRYPEALDSGAVTCTGFLPGSGGGVLYDVVTWSCIFIKFTKRATPQLVTTPTSLHSDSTSLTLFPTLALEWAQRSWVGKTFNLDLVRYTCLFDFQSFPHIEELVLGVLVPEGPAGILPTPHSADYRVDRAWK